MKICALLYGKEKHYIDHLAPLASLLKIPFFTNEEEIASTVKTSYPETEVIYRDYLNFPLHLIKNFDLVIYCNTRSAFDRDFALLQDLHQKKIKSIWCPHGNSDKGRHIPFMEALEKEMSVMVYGPKMADFLKDKEVLDKIPKIVHVGNFRRHYYLQHKDFFDKMVLKLLGPKKVKTFLYAPTWHDYEKSSSLRFDSLFHDLPPEYRIVIKPHPNTLLEHSVEIQRLMWEYEKNERIYFLNDFYPIYPLLNYVDGYVGDMSSIGYDFLAFDKPMFFFNPSKRDPLDPSLYLFRCGKEIQSFKELEGEQGHLSAERKAVYEYTFGRPEQVAFSNLWEKLEYYPLPVLRID